MKQFSLHLDVTQQRPVILLKNSLTALLDTGAYFPIWSDDEEILKNDLSGILVKNHVPITGFGGTTYGNLYQATFEVGSLVFPNMHIIANSELNTSYNMILSATMFQHIRYEVDDENHMLNITVPDKESMIRNLVIEDSDGKLHVLCNSVQKFL